MQGTEAYSATFVTKSVAKLLDLISHVSPEWPAFSFGQTPPLASFSSMPSVVSWTGLQHAKPVFKPSLGLCSAAISLVRHLCTLPYDNTATGNPAKAVLCSAFRQLAAVSHQNLRDGAPPAGCLSPLLVVGGTLHALAWRDKGDASDPRQLPPLGEEVLGEFVRACEAVFGAGAAAGVATEGGGGSAGELRWGIVRARMAKALWELLMFEVR